MRTTWERRDEFELLEIPRDATDDEIRSAYRLQMKVWHPDRFAGDDLELQVLAVERSRVLQDAYETLKDPVQRKVLSHALGAEKIDEPVFPEPLQNDPRAWKSLSSWMKEEDVGEPFDRKMAYTAGKLLEQRREPSEKQMPYMLAAWETGIAGGFDPEDLGQ